MARNFKDTSELKDMMNRQRREGKPRIRVNYGRCNPSKIIKGWDGNRFMFDAAILSCWLEFLDKNKAP